MSLENAQATLDRCKNALFHLRQQNSIAVDLEYIIALQSEIITSLRAIGTIAYNAYKRKPDERKILDCVWEIYKTQKIYRDFVEKQRNELLKEGKGVFSKEDFGINCYFTARGEKIQTQVTYSPQKNQKDPISIFDRNAEESIIFWEKYLNDVEAALYKKYDDRGS